ncbi:MAG: DUF924 family protein [Pseudomonadota bacterium]
MTTSQTYDWPDKVLGFWFGELEAKDWFSKSEALDADIRSRFGSLHNEHSTKAPHQFLASPNEALAAIILFDQLSRNQFRGTPRSFASDQLSLGIARQMVAKGWDLHITHKRRIFVYLPFEHSENLADQDICIKLVEALEDEQFIRYAHAHRDVIVRFGRFPHRNAILGRISTPEEDAYLCESGTGF